MITRYTRTLGGMSIAGALVLLLVGLLLAFLTLGVLHVVGIILAAVGLVGAVVAAMDRPRR